MAAPEAQQAVVAVVLVKMDLLLTPVIWAARVAMEQYPHYLAHLQLMRVAAVAALLLLEFLVV
jgi:uncharacterized protein (DUF952 family)